MAAIAGGINKVEIYLFPTCLTDEGLKTISEIVSDDLIIFWKNLKLGFSSFEKTKYFRK